MDEARSGRRAGRKRARTGAVKVAMSLVLLAAPRLPSAEALKLASISEDRRHLGVGLLRAVEVVRGRYERAWALVSASEPSSSDLDTALELLQANAKQWESLEPAVKLWTERDNEGPHEGEPAPSKHHSQGDRSSASSERDANRTGEAGSEAEEGHHEERAGAPGVSDTTSRIYDEAASLLAHNRAVLGQALARSGRTSEGIVELEAACPEILEYQQNAQGRRDSKSWLHCYANLAEMYKTQKRFEDASNLLARMPWLPSPQQAPSATAEAAAAEAEGESIAEKTPPTKPGSGDQIPVVPLAAASRSADITTTTAGDNSQTSASKPSSNPEHDASSTTSEEGTGLEPSPPHEHSHEHGGGKDESGDPLPSSAARGEGARSEASPARGAGAARVAGLNKAAAAASAAAAAESAAAAAAAVETGAEAAARALVQRHADAMRASMNELVGELAVTTATRPSASKNWLDSRVLEAEEILAAVRSGSLTVAPTTDQQQHNSGDAVPEDVPPLPVGSPGHADILREASHYLSAVKGVAGQGWAYVDNELSRMERHPPQAVKQGFQSRREVIHTFRYLLMKAQQYASENQARTTPGSGSGASQTSLGLRGKNRGRKASASSKAPRKEGAARKQSPRSQSGSSSKQSDGLLTLFVGAAVALLVAAVSTGRVGSQGRRREVVRQRTATRAAKTVGRYVRPPQRGAVPALLSYLWGNLKRSGLMVSSQATSSASLMRTLILTAWAAAFERLRTALGRSRVDAAGGKPPSSSSSKKSASSGQGHHKQRSKKGGKKTTPSLPPPHPPASLSREATVSITPPVSPPRRSRSSASDARRNCTDASVIAAAAPAEAKSDVAAAAAVVASIGKRPAREASVSSKSTPSSVDAVDVSASPATEKAAERPADTSDPSAGCGVGAGGVSDATADDAAPTVSVPTAAVAATAAAVAGAEATAVELAAEMTAGVPFPDVMTAEQVQAMVEEDERAWEQARLSEKLQSKTNAAAAARPQLPRSASSGSGAAKRAETGVVNAGAVCGLGNDGWSEVGGSGSRARSGGGGGAGGGGGDGARGRVLSMRNVRAVARASRPSSPGSDPATTTSASSSECSEGSKDKPRHRHVVDSRGGRGGRGSGEAGNATIGTGKGAIPRAGRGGVPASRGGASSASSGSGGGGSGAGRAHATRPPQGRSAASRAATKDTEQAYPRPSRASYAPWATPSPQAPRVTGKPQPPSARSAVSASATLKSGSPGVDSDLARTAAPAKLPLRADRSHTNVLRQPLRAKAAPVAAGVGKAAELKNVGGVDVGVVSKTSPAVVVETAAPAPVAWTNTPSHPLGMKAEPAPLPPASEPPRPPPQHQQHWQRQQQREQQQRQQQHHQLQQQQQQQQQHFFHQQESHLLPMPAAPVQQQQHHHHVGGHHYPPLSLPPHHHHQHNHQHHQPPLPPPPHEVVPARFLPPSDEPFAPALAPGTAVAQMPSATVSHAAPSPIVYTAQAHPTPMHTYSPTVSPRDSGDDVGDRSGNDNGGAGSPNGETSHYHVVEGSYDSPGLSGVGDGGSGSGGGSGGHFSLDAPAVIPPPQIVVLPSSQEQQQQQQQQQGSFSPLAMLPSEDGGGSGGGSGGASVMFGQGPPVGYCPTTGGGGGGGSGDAGEVFEALMGALCWQVEYYFSADNLVNDAYLRGLMDSDGFVAVSKIMVFNRVRCMTSDMSLLIAAMRRSTELELQERDNSGEVCVRTVHSPLHWTKEQVPLPKAPPAVVAIEPEHVPYEAEEVAHEEKPVPLGEGESVSCEAVSCETVSCETAVSCEPPQDGQE